MSARPVAAPPNAGSTRSAGLRFLIAGGLNAAFGYALFRALLYGFSALPHAVALAQATSYATGIVISFAANRRWTFRSTGTAHREALRFVAAHLGGLALSTVLMQLGVVALRLPLTACFVLVTGITAAVNFAVQRLWVFQSQNER